MLVPRNYRYQMAPPMEDLDEKKVPRARRSAVLSTPEKTQPLRPTTPARTTTEPVRVPTPPLAVPKRERTHSARSMPTLNKNAATGYRRPSAAHDPSALPPAVAALLAVTQIPRPKPNQFRRRTATSRRISIDELINEWKTDETFQSSYGSSPALSVLLEDGDGTEEPCPTPVESMVEESYLHTRSTSAESVPSLETDDRSLKSNGSLSTPESLRSRKSISNLRKATSRSLPTAEECHTNHPLVPQLLEDDDPDDGLMISPPSSRASTPKPASRFKSNLTSSLQALKNAAINSISSFTNGGTSTPWQRAYSSNMSDDVLWSHPFLFPRFSSEVRPAIDGTPSKAQRRYLNPMPLTFEEQEAPYQLALHGPYLAEQIDGAPTIPMQTYSRTRRKSANKRSGPDPSSEAGRALMGATGVRQRELRENSDFLRMIVLEMNMRREGKLESGRAKLWLPPRKASFVSEHQGRVPKRWVGESAY